MSSDRQRTRTERWLGRFFMPMFEATLGEFVVQDGVIPDGPIAEAAERKATRRRESIIPTYFFYAYDFLWFAVTFPIWGTLLAIEAYRSRE